MLHVFCYFAVFAVVHPGTRSGYRGTTIRDRSGIEVFAIRLADATSQWQSGTSRSVALLLAALVDG